MRFVSLFLAVSGVLAGADAGLAKPLLTSSEDSFGRACLRFDDSAARIEQICRRALDEPGASDAQRIEFMVNLGDALRFQDRYDAAREIYAEALELGPQSTSAQNGMGWLHYDLDEYEEARARFAAAVAIKPTSRGLAGLGSTYYRGDLGPGETALEYLAAAVALDREYAWALREQGWVLRDMGRYGSAVESFRKATDIAPQNFNGQMGMASALEDLGEYEAALNHANRAAAIEPENSWMLNERADILLGLGRYAQALRDATRATDIEPDWSDPWVRRAWALERLGKRGRALEILDEAEEHTGYDAFLVYWKAEMLRDEGRLDDAEREIRRNTDQDGADGWDMRLLVDIKLEKDDVVAARAAMARVLEIDPGSAMTLFFDALVMVHEDRVEQAEARFADAIAEGLDPGKAQFMVTAMIEKGYRLRAVLFGARY